MCFSVQGDFSEVYVAWPVVSFIKLVFFVIGYYVYTHQQNAPRGEIAYFVSPLHTFTKRILLIFKSYIYTTDTDSTTSIVVSTRSQFGQYKVLYKIIIVKVSFLT